jgi:hypothetical protein
MITDAFAHTAIGFSSNGAVCTSSPTARWLDPRIRPGSPPFELSDKKSTKSIGTKYPSVREWQITWDSANV